MYEGLIDILERITSGERAMTEVQARWGIDRWFTFPAMVQSCRHAVARMRDYGLSETGVEEFPADGRTVFGSWRMPLAWDAVSATLEVLDPVEQAGRLLCDYQAVPCGLTMWSGPTPPQGVTAEVVAIPTIDGGGDFSRRDVAGKIVLTNLRGNAVRNEAIRRGAAGVVSDHCRHPLEMPDAVDWMNAWSEDPEGWGLKAGERNTWGFNISHRQGQELRGWLASGRVLLRARVDTRVYEGVMPVATGVLPGLQEEEVLVLAHGAEQGANDNASGCAVMLEALRALAVAIHAGTLAVPRRSIRALVTWEIYGTQAFYAAHTARFQSTVAGLCLDMVGEDQSITRGHTLLHRSPHAMLSYADALSRSLAGEYWGVRHPGYRWAAAEFSMTDNITAHPSIGVPTPYLGADGSTDRFWHTSEDTPDKVSPANLKMMATYTAVYLYTLATAGLNETPWLAELMAADARTEIQDRVTSGVGAIVHGGTPEEAQGAADAAARSVRYLEEVHARAVGTLERLVAAAERSRLRETVTSHRTGLSKVAAESTARLARVLSGAADARGWKLPRQAPPAATPEEREAADIVVQRIFFGSLCLDTIPLNERGGLSVNRFGGPLSTVLAWCDGTRNLAEAARLAGEESGREIRDYLSKVKVLAGFGLLRILKA